MKLLNIVSCGLIVACIGLPAGAFAQESGFRPQAEDQRPQSGQQAGPGQPMPRRELRDGGGLGQGERGRMSPDQRRQLRQDIQEAGKDIYRGPRQGRGEGRRAERR